MAFFAAPHAGIDRGSMPMNESTKPKTPLLNWMKEMYIRSNFTFTGVYLTAPIHVDVKKDGIMDHVYTLKAGNISSGWTQNLRVLETQGWGLMLIYLGYSYDPDHEGAIPPYDVKDYKLSVDLAKKTWEALPPEVRVNVPPRVTRPPRYQFPLKLAGERGVLHALHIKKILSDVKDDDLNGAVVFLDNEGGYVDKEGTLVEYYRTMFETLRMPTQNDPGKVRTVRPGLYAFNSISDQLLEKQKDVFLWNIDLKGGRQRPWLEKGGRLTVTVEEFPVTAVDYSQTETMLSVGRQYRLSETWMPTRKLSNNVPITRDWDLNSCLVRDPKYPEANPRFRIMGNTTIRGDFRKTDFSKDTPPDAFLPKGTLPNVVSAMMLRDSGNQDGKPIEGIAVEPEAPIVLSSPSMLFTIDKTGLLATSQTLGGNKWSTIGLVPIPGTPPPLRRLRALNAVTRSSIDTQVFFISRDNTLWGTRLQPEEKKPEDKSPPIYKWSEARLMAEGVLAHPFSNMVTCCLPGLSVDTFFLNMNGLLHTASWVTTQPEWPGKQHLALEQDKPSLLLGTALAVATPSADHELVFGIGRNLCLYMIAFTRGKGWTKLAPLGDADAKLFAHSRLAAIGTAADTVKLAAINNEGTPCIYTIIYSAPPTTTTTTTGQADEKKEDPTWKIKEARTLFIREILPLPLNWKAGLQPGQGEALTWNINPYGDISLNMEGAETFLTCAGTSWGKSGMLRIKINPAGEQWKRILGGEPDEN